MTLMAGNILEGTVVNITNFGAFVEIEGKTGLVHISEVADSFVKDIREHLNVVRKSAKPAEIEWKQEKKKAQSGEKFEDIMSKFLKDSEERQQDFKKHQEFRSRNRKGF